MPENDPPRDSVLNVTKALVGIPAEHDVFDIELITYINGVFATLHQLGVGPKTPYIITGPSESWEAFLESTTGLESVKTYMGAKVRLIFDPPASGFGTESLKKQCDEFEWRLNVRAEELT